MCEEEKSSEIWCLTGLRNVNGQIGAYSQVEEETAVGGQGECRRRKAHLLNSGENAALMDVAIKRLTYAFSSSQDAKYAFRELGLLSLVRHPNLLQLLDVLLPGQVQFPLSPENIGQNLARFDRLFLVTKFGGETLSSQMMRRNLTKRGWELAEIGSITCQLLAGLHALHEAGIVHRDLKANNIVLDARGQLKILDFGCGRYIRADTRMTPNMMVPFYRPPEIFLGINSYDTKVDIWSVGCIFAELLLGRRLFNGTDFERQWPKFVQLLGNPDLDGCYNGALGQIRPSYLEFARKLGKIEPKGWENLLPDGLFRPAAYHPQMNAQNARDLLSRMLQFDPAQRLSASNALAHPFFASFRDENFGEIIQEEAANCDYNFADEMEDGTVDQWKEKILMKIGHFMECPNCRP